MYPARSRIFIYVYTYDINNSSRFEIYTSIKAQMKNKSIGGGKFPTHNGAAYKFSSGLYIYIYIYSSSTKVVN